MRQEPLYLALTRPSMMLGVPAAAAIAVFVAVLVVFINTGHPAVLILAVPAHLAAWLCCREDERFFDLLLAWGKAIARGGAVAAQFNARTYGT